MDFYDRLLLRLRPLAKKVPGVRGAVRATRGAIDPNVALLQKLEVFAPYSAGTSKVRLDLALHDANSVFPVLCEMLKTAGRPLPDVTDVKDFPQDDAERGACDRLVERFRHHGSDKGSMHNYHLVYGSILHRLGGVDAMLEVGIGTNNTDTPSNMGPRGRPGASLRAFRDHLASGRIFGADIDRRVLFSEDRIETFYVDQTVPKTFDALGVNIGTKLDLIIDDGLHSPAANLAVVNFALRQLSARGWLVVEDIAAAAEPVWKVVSLLLGERFNCQLLQTNVALMFVAEPRS